MPDRFRKVLLPLLSVCTIVAAGQALPVDQDSTRGGYSMTAIVDVSVIPMDGERVLTHQTVVVQDGVISAIGRSRAGHATGPAIGTKMFPEKKDGDAATR